MENIKDVIEKISEERYKFQQDEDKSWDEKTNKNKIDHGEIIDRLGKAISKHIKNHFDDLEFDFIFDELTKLGDAPSLIYDDNGHFAISSIGIQSVSCEDFPADFEATMFIKAKDFRDTPKEALKAYIFDSDTEE